MTDESRIKILTIEVSDEYCKDILVTCVEGGSNYWARFRNVVRDEELNVLECEVMDIEADPDNNGSQGEWKKITIEDIRRGVNIAMKPECTVHRTYKAMIANDDNDAISSDIVLQAAMFGEVIYS